ncbi:Replicative DNA helicase [Actinoplanes sp. SE50]|uniref:LAGLIDADG family homing endonuclease n=1 Tax=unclassified Actinoplanes TaxID=2626549 RepID=UPI00023EBC0A|nr:MULTISPECIES: LAGLIDADG family homing endonuclease [unclassified Actinoplanes]AEV86825.1 Replicative DNA helicase [Actinoplanes sp. SE50/110]ATO85222.1 Replicative DNA helicase [Actinoplanes sp. SE50]SLM02632.1 hypothetical protein ACSP50_5914 [Actinoplanes sp. SE50/110]
MPSNPVRIAPSWGHRGPHAGRASHVAPGMEYQGTTHQMCGLFPFTAGSGAPTLGVPIGRHMLWGEVVCLDPLEWLRAGLVTNPGVFVLGQPGVGKALDVDTPVPTPHGVARLGDLKPGDAVFDEHGRPTTVVAVSEVWTGRTCSRLRFSDATTVVADDEHLWVTQTQAQRQARVVARLRPPARRPLGTAAEQARVAELLAAATPGQDTTLPDLAAQVGWDQPSVRDRLYRWATGWPVTGRAGNARLFDRYSTLQQTALMLAAPVNDQREDTGTVTTRQIRQTLTHAGKTNHAVPVAPPVSGHDRPLPVPARLLGLWLGDGATDRAMFTTADPALAAEFSAAGYRVLAGRRYRYSISSQRLPAPPAGIVCRRCRKPFDATYTGQQYCSRPCAARAPQTGHRQARTCQHCRQPLRRSSTGQRHRACAHAQTLVGQLRALGVLGDKHIPAEYLRASVEQRRQLLSGLLDTDGTVSPGGQVQYTSCDQRLAEDVFDLIASLGYRPAMNRRATGSTVTAHRYAYQIGFTTTDEVFGLARKRDAHRQRRRAATLRTAVRYIVAVEPVPSRPVRCIQVANPSGQFLVTRAFIATHNSTIVKRLVTGMSGCGTHTLILGDTKPDYTPLVRHLEGQVIRVGRGLDRINPLDSGPLGAVLSRMGAEESRQLRLEVRGRRMSLLLALCALVRGGPLSNTEEVILGRAIDVLAERLPHDPTVPDVLHLVESGADELRAAARARTEGEYRRRVDQLVPTLALLCEGSLRGVFDGPTSTALDLDAPAVSVDISQVAAAGDQLVAAAMLCTWSYGYAMVDAAAALADHGLAPRRQYLGVMDELWRALRGASGLVEHADALTRLNRQKGMASVMVTHSLADLDALPTEADRAKAQGFIERAAIKILAGLPPRELARVNDVVRLSGREQDLVASWAAPEAWFTGAAHPGRGKYLIKTGERPGLPVAMTLVDEEIPLYDTDAAIRDVRPAVAGRI